MSTLRARLLPITIALAIVATPALAGCSMLENPIENVIEGATGENVELPGNSVPDGFPSEVPLIDGEVVFGAAIADGYNLSIRVDGPETIDDIEAQLEGAGFEKQVGGGTGEGSTNVFTGDAYSVVVVIVSDDSGYLANYSVAPIAK